MLSALCFPSSSWSLSTRLIRMAHGIVLPLIRIIYARGVPSPARVRSSAYPSRGRALLIFLAGSRRMARYWLLQFILIPPKRGRAAPESRRTLLIFLAHWSAIIHFYLKVYMCLLWKIFDNFLPLGFHRKCFCVRVPDIIRKLKNKKLPVGTRYLSSFILRNGRLALSEQTTWWHSAKKHATWDYVIFRSIFKSAPGTVQ